MRKVILKKDNNKTVKASELTDYDLIAIQFNDGSKGYVLKVSEDQYICATIVLERNEYVSKVIGKNIEDLLNKLISVKQILQFECEKEYRDFILS